MASSLCSRARYVELACGSFPRLTARWSRGLAEESTRRTDNHLWQRQSRKESRCKEGLRGVGSYTCELIMQGPSQSIARCEHRCRRVIEVHLLPSLFHPVVGIPMASQWHPSGILDGIPMASSKNHSFYRCCVKVKRSYVRTLLLK